MTTLCLSMAVFVCEVCDSRWVEDSLPRRGSICFKCHVKNIRIGFTHGKEDFHGPTVRERQQQQVKEAAAAGVNAEPVGTRWI